MSLRHSYISIITTCIFLLACQPGEPTYHTWQVYKGNHASTSYSSLDQINLSNVDQLEVAWTFYPKDVPEGTRFGKYECNPIIVDDVMYATSSRSWLYALDARTGEKLWSYDPFDGGRGGGMKRGVAYWKSGQDERILFTAGTFLYAIDAKTGEPISSFGEQGRVNLNLGLGRDPDSIQVAPTSPGMIYQNLIILGSGVGESQDAAPGHIRAYDVRTGEMKWIFHTIPHPGERGYETWPEGAWKYTGGVNNWAGMSLDEERGIVYIPLGSPTYDFYGANRKGKNLYGNSILALEASHGQLIWYFQAVHHDLWDYDLPAPPSLATIKRDGKSQDVVTVATKMGFLFVFDRETGESIFPIEEREVPSSRIPGEEAWPTQPFPLKPEPLVRQSMGKEDILDVSEESYKRIRSRVEELRYEGLYTPPDTAGTLFIPGTRGGINWGGTAVDPAGILYVNVNESPEIITMKRTQRQDAEPSQNLYLSGERYYLNYCAICHGKDLKGQQPLYPSLTGIKERKPESDVLSILTTGQGRMPAFSHLTERQREAIVAFLYDNRTKTFEADGRPLPQSNARVPLYRNVTAYGYFRGPEGFPAIQPPWGTLNAVDLNTGMLKWKIPLGSDPEYDAQNEVETGLESWGGPIATGGGLIFIAATKDRKFRAYNKETGEKVWETTLPGAGYATPATYMCEGKQYVVIAFSGTEKEPGGGLVVFSLASFP